MAFPAFVSEGQITTDGLHLIEFIEAQYTPYDKPGVEANLAALNSLSGPFAEYYTIVAKMKGKTPKQWLESFPQSAKNAYEIMKFVEEKAAAEAAEAAKLNETVDRTSKIEAELAQLKEALSAKVSELEAKNAALIEENEALKAKPAAAKGKKKADEPVIETEPEKVESDAPETE